jgi:hypothetical protein
MQAYYELNTSCFKISGCIVYYSDRAVSWTAGKHISIPDMGMRLFSKDIRHFLGPAEPRIQSTRSGGSFAVDKAACS